MRNLFTEGEKNPSCCYDSEKVMDIDELPEVDGELDDEINCLPGIEELPDEIDMLPDCDDTLEKYKPEIIELAGLYRSVDALYEREGVVYSNDGRIEKVNQPKLSKLQEVVKNTGPIEAVKTVTYFSLLKFTMAVDYSVSILEHYSGFKVEDSYFGEIRSFYKDLVTPEYLKKHYDDKEVSPELIADTLADITCEAVDAVAYLEAKMLLGIASVVEDAVTFAVGTISDIANRPDIAETMYKTDISKNISETLDESYEGLELIKKIGKCSEAVGETGTYIALTVLSASQAPVVAIASSAAIGIARAGEVTREAVEKTGEYSHRELLAGIIGGVVSVVSAKLVPTINEGIEKVADPAIKKIEDRLGNKVVHHVVENVLGTAEAAFIGGIDGAIFESQEIISDFVSEALGIEEDFEVNWNQFFKSVATGAAINGSVYLISNIAKDINKHLDEKQAAQLKEVTKEKQGGSYKDVKKTSNGETHEVHHIPSDSASNLDRNEGPAIKMEKADHRKTASCGNSREAREYQRVQKELIEQGKFLEALQMDIDDIHEKFGDKYDDAIAEMMEYVKQLIEEGKING